MRSSSSTVNPYEMEELKEKIIDEKFQIHELKMENTEINTKILRVSVLLQKA